MSYSQPSKYPYESIPNDPLGVRIYTLKNGLKVFITINKEAPRVQTMIAVKAGSKYDPPQTTGLAHYLEHMMFKGTHQYGTENWAKEKVILDTISNLFEEHLKEHDEAKKKEIYAKIDAASYRASELAIPSEYNKMVKSIGASGTNAFTSNDMTVYVNDIPSNTIEKWLQVERERFGTLVLRLFHTELETVYEEFNRNQDLDRRWSYQAVDSMLMPNHPYGTQTTIGLGEHLKNPSMVNIHKYFDTYYVPNNVAIILAGDVDPDKTMEAIEKTFGDWQSKLVPQFIKQPPVLISSPQTAEIKGPQNEHLFLGYRFDGAGSRDAMMITLLDMILSNGTSGLLDLNLTQKQKVLSVNASPQINKDYSVHLFYGEPKQGQKLEEVKDLILEQVEKLKKGEFDEWMLKASIQNIRLEEMKQAEENRNRASKIMNAFVVDRSWKNVVNELDEMSKVTKADLVKFANEHYTNNYAVCYKRIGEPNRHKVDKPKITPVVINKDSTSAFKKKFDKISTGDITAKFMDFNKDIQRSVLNGGLELDYVRNPLNKTFQLNYIFDMGTDNIRDLGLAVGYLPYLGTDKYTAGDLKKEFFKLGLSFNVYSNRDRAYISLSGLEENMEAGVKLFEHIIANVKLDITVYNDLVVDITKKRENAKRSKETILYSALNNYAIYGKKNPFNNVMSEQELKQEKAAHLVELIHSLPSYKHSVYYYGQKTVGEVTTVLNKEHKVVTPLKEYPKPIEYPELPLNETQVLYCNYDMKQAEILMLAKDERFNKSIYPELFMYNRYYGGGLSSILFQEIREKQALAYSVNSNFGVPERKEESHYLNAYVGTQADKMKTALSEMNRLLNNFVAVPQQYEEAKSSVQKSIESEWTAAKDIYWKFDAARKRGMDYDVRKDIYAKTKNLSMDDVKHFFDTHVKGKKFTYLVIGKSESVDKKVLEELGSVKTLTLEELFGY